MRTPDSLGEASLKSLELFAGAGGLALGVEQAGFTTSRLYEIDREAVKTLEANAAPKGTHFAAAEVSATDLRSIDWLQEAPGQIDLLSGGPPCQPFSQGGRHKGYNDARDMFPAAARAVAALRPRAFVFENVRGLLRETMSDYLNYVLRMLAAPSLARGANESWRDHDSRLRRGSALGNIEAAREYRVTVHGIDAADYGVPQRRHRVFIVGRSLDDIGAWAFPGPTHSALALAYSKFVDGTYWEQHPNARRGAPPSPKRLAELAAAVESLAPDERPTRWNTLRDAIYDLGAPLAQATGSPTGHVRVEGARSYPGHSGSPWDEPAKTVKAGAHGVPGGENMIRHANGAVRYFTIREAARLQGFPDDYEFVGAWGRAMKQIGNAVPVPLARLVAQSLRAAMESASALPRSNENSAASGPARANREQSAGNAGRETLVLGEQNRPNREAIL